MNVEKLCYFVEIFMFLTVLNDLRDRGTRSVWAGPHTRAAGASRHFTLGGSCGNGFLRSPSEHMPMPMLPGHVLSEKETYPSQGDTFVLLRHSLTWVDSAWQDI